MGGTFSERIPQRVNRDQDIIVGGVVRFMNE